MEQATFAAGCFWGIEETFRQLPGVLETAVGYTDGSTTSPTYEQVCTGTSGHAEAVQLTFDPAKISYLQLLEVFWQCHDPTQRNRQGPDVGSQYRTAIFCHSPQQQTAALSSKTQQQSSEGYSKLIATEIVPASTFYRAEEYHQQYVEKRG